MSVAEWPGRVLAVGGAHLDRRGTLFAPAVPGASNPGTWREEAGGGAFNAARGLARLGRPVRLIAPRGGDAAAETVAAAAEEAGIEDTPLTFLDRKTPSYTAIIETDGNLLVALADMALYDLLSPRQIARRAMREAIGAADAVLTDANLPEATLAALAAACARQDRPLFAIAISPAKATRLFPALPLIAGLFMNAAELHALTGCPQDDIGRGLDRLAAMGAKCAVVSRGARPAVAFDETGRWQVQPPEIPRVADVTGAGDALAAGFIHARMQGLAVAGSLRSGVAAAGLAAASRLAVSEELNAAALQAALGLVPQAECLAGASPSPQHHREA